MCAIVFSTKRQSIMSKKIKPSVASAETPEIVPPRRSKLSVYAPLINKKAAARAAGDAARAAGVIDPFSRKKPVSAKPVRPRDLSDARPPRSEAIEVDIMRLDADGVGIARHDGKDFIIAGTYPGEKVTATIEAKGQFRLIGRLRRVIKAHPHRIAKRCDSLTSCQGCPLLCLDEAAQFEIKQIRIRSAFNQYPQLKGVLIAPIWSAPEPFGYRSNAKLVFGRKRGLVQLGLYRRGTHDVVDLAGCPLHHPLINRIASVVREEVEKQEIYIYNAEKGRGLLRYLLIRVSPSRNKAMVTFVVAERDLKQLPHLAKSLQKRVPEVVSVQQNVNATTGNIIVGRDTQRLAGVSDLLDQVGDIRLQLAPASFFQVNHAQAARIYQLVREWARLQASETAVDLYCGIGGIALHLARDAGRVYGIETIEEAVKNARANALLNDLRNCIFIAGDAEEVVEDLCSEIQRAEVVVLNPPRSGCQPQVLKAAASLQPRTLIYVSCNPETLARDLSLLHPLGYAADAVQPVDMFPQTAHIETVVRLVPITP
jgi:23S rRNA (uracil1939-C5)-methyltransferase